MKLIKDKEFGSKEDIAKFIYEDSWCCEHLKELDEEKFDEVCELVAQICECYDEMDETQLNDILRFDEEIDKIIYGEE